MNVALGAPLVLPCGVTLANRIAKAAMTEGLADSMNRATPAHEALYRRWAQGGAALLITGNVQVDHRYLERPGNVVIEETQGRQALDRLRAYARTVQGTDAQIWVQLSHGGRQSPISVCPEPIAPSAIPLNLPGKLFAPPRAMRQDEISDVISRFGFAARTVREAGFGGVQIHGAHGYLISQFLSPASNHRTDRWGGTLENRARLLLEIVDVVRREVGPHFPVAVKLNSADFLAGGFTQVEALQVIEMLNTKSLDLLEVTGGTYEAPVMMGAGRASTQVREAYFAEFAAQARRVAAMPVMATGGFRSRQVMQAALASGQVDVVGMARPFCSKPNLVNDLLAGAEDVAPTPERQLRLGPSSLLDMRSRFSLIRALNVLGQRSWFYMALRDLGAGREAPSRRGILGAMMASRRAEQAAISALKSQRRRSPGPQEELQGNSRNEQAGVGHHG